MADPKVYNKEETEVLRQARHLRDLLEHPAWKEYVKILEAQIALREQILLLPMAALSSASSEFQGMDYQSRLAHLESIKGALIGLRLCRDLPQTTVDQARDIVRDHGEPENE